MFAIVTRRLACGGTHLSNLAIAPTTPVSMCSLAHRLDDRLRLDRYARYAHEQIDHFFLVVGEAVGVELLADGRVFGLLFLVLVENPFQRRAVAELVVLGLGRHPGQRGLRIEHNAAGFPVGLEYRSRRCGALGYSLSPPAGETAGVRGLLQCV